MPTTQQITIKFRTLSTAKEFAAAMIADGRFKVVGPRRALMAIAPGGKGYKVVYERRKIVPIAIKSSSRAYKITVGVV